MQPLSKYASPVLSLSLLAVISSVAVGVFPLPLYTPGFQHFATVVTLFLWTAAPVAILYSLSLAAFAMGAGVVRPFSRAWRRMKAYLLDEPSPAGDALAAPYGPEAEQQRHPHNRNGYHSDALALCMSALVLPARRADWITLLLGAALVLGVLLVRARRSRPSGDKAHPSYADNLYRHAGMIAATAVVLGALEAVVPAARLVETLRSVPVALIAALGAGALLSASLPAALVAAFWVEGLTGMLVAVVVPVTALAVRWLWQTAVPAPAVDERDSGIHVHVLGILTWCGYALSVALLYTSMPQNAVNTMGAIFVISGILIAGASEIRGLLGRENAGVATRGALFTVLLPLAIGPAGTGLAGQPDLPVRLQVAQVGLRLNERAIQEYGFERMSEIPDSDELLLDEHIFYDVVHILAREPAEHAGRTMRFEGYVGERTTDGLTVARDVVWCCLEHAERVGFLLRDPPDDIPRGSWIEVVAEVAYEPGRNTPVIDGSDVFIPATASRLRRVERPQFEYVLPF